MDSLRNDYNHPKPCKSNIPANICGNPVLMDSHRFELDEVIPNCTVEILKCKVCGEVSIGWYRNG